MKGCHGYMNKSDLIESIASKASLTINKAEEVVDLFFSSMMKTLLNGGRVEIRGFGAFMVKSYDAYTGRNPKTGEKIAVSAKNLPIWRTGTELRRRVNMGKEKEFLQKADKTG